MHQKLTTLEATKLQFWFHRVFNWRASGQMSNVLSKAQGRLKSSTSAEAVSLGPSE